MYTVSLEYALYIKDTYIMLPEFIMNCVQFMTQTLQVRVR